jgi:hypothetical protein
MTIYVDSGVLLKAYLEEAGSDRATDSRPRGGSGRERFPSLPSICVKHRRRDRSAGPYGAPERAPSIYRRWGLRGSGCGEAPKDL